MPADIVLVNANVRTMDPNQPVAQAVAIKKNKILKVGSNQEINRLVTKSTHVISLSGKTIVPGLIDTHVHVADFGRCLLWLDLASAESIPQLQNLVKEKVNQTDAGKWIIGRGWNEKRFREKRMLNLSDLDEAAPNNPVILYHEAAMICAVNSKALQLAGITRQTSVPLGGTVDKDSQTGEVAGIFRDAATNLVWQAVPEPTETELLDATELACQKLAEAGLTSVHWLVLSEAELPIIKQLGERGTLIVGVNVIVPDTLLKKIIGLKSSAKSLLHFGGVMIAVDGYLDSKTAALREPYADEPANSGKLFYSEQALSNLVAKVLAVGLEPVIHAMGDRAVDTVLRVIETEKQKTIRFRIEQAALLNKELIGRVRKQNVVITVQPKVIGTEFLVWSARKRLGSKRAKWLHPLKSLLRQGVVVAGGSDCPMEPLNPLLGIQDAISRDSFQEQRLSVEEALGLYTLGAAYSSCEENVKGSIEEGKLADLTVLSSDLFAVSHDKIASIKVEMTIVGGNVVYQKHE